MLMLKNLVLTILMLKFFSVNNAIPTSNLVNREHSSFCND